MVYQLTQMPLYKSLHLEELKNAKTEAELIKLAAEQVRRWPDADLLLAVWRHCCLIGLTPEGQQRVIIFMDGLVNE